MRLPIADVLAEVARNIVVSGKIQMDPLIRHNIRISCQVAFVTDLIE